MGCKCLFIDFDAAITPSHNILSFLNELLLTINIRICVYACMYILTYIHIYF